MGDTVGRAGRLAPGVLCDGARIPGDECDILAGNEISSPITRTSCPSSPRGKFARYWMHNAW